MVLPWEQMSWLPLMLGTTPAVSGLFWLPFQAEVFPSFLDSPVRGLRSRSLANGVDIRLWLQGPNLLGEFSQLYIRIIWLQRQAKFILLQQGGNSNACNSTVWELSEFLSRKPPFNWKCSNSPWYVHNRFHTHLSTSCQIYVSLQLSCTACYFPPNRRSAQTSPVLPLVFILLNYFACWTALSIYFFQH